MTETKWGPWIDWHGGECPIPWAQAGDFQIRLRSGMESGPAWKEAELWCWERRGRDVSGDITAYRVRADLMHRVAPAAAFVPTVTTNEAAGYREFVTADRPTVTQDADGYSLLLDMETRVPIGVRWAIVPAAAAPDRWPKTVQLSGAKRRDVITVTVALRPADVALLPHPAMREIAAVAAKLPDAAPATDPVVEAMAEALKPFAGMGSELLGHALTGTGRHLWSFNNASLTWGQFEVARAALAAYEAQKEGRGS